MENYFSLFSFLFSLFSFLFSLFSFLFSLFSFLFSLFSFLFSLCRFLFYLSSSPVSKKGERIHGPIGWAINIIVLLGTLFGVAVSVGLRVLQLNTGLVYLFDISVSSMSQIIIAVITLVATVSVALGLGRGIKRLSYLNIGLAILLLLFVWVVGPTLFITSGAVQNLGIYLQNLLWMSLWTEAYQAQAGNKAGRFFIGRGQFPGYPL